MAVYNMTYVPHPDIKGHVNRTFSIEDRPVYGSSRSGSDAERTD